MNTKRRKQLIVAGGALALAAIFLIGRRRQAATASASFAPTAGSTSPLTQTDSFGGGGGGGSVGSFGSSGFDPGYGVVAQPGLTVADLQTGLDSVRQGFKDAIAQLPPPAAPVINLTVPPASATPVFMPPDPPVTPLAPDGPPPVPLPRPLPPIRTGGRGSGGSSTPPSRSPDPAPSAPKPSPGKEPGTVWQPPRISPVTGAVVLPDSVRAGVAAVLGGGGYVPATPSKSPAPAEPARKYYTYKREVPLGPGQTLHFTRGKGYYAA